MITPATARRPNHLWPDVNTEDGARLATRDATMAATFVAVVAGGLSALAALGVQVRSITPWPMLDVLLFGLAAWGISRGSRVAAWTALLFHIYERVCVLVLDPHADTVVGLAFLLFFIHGVRGTAALRRLRMERSRSESVPIE